jgi:hypothetical protein
MMANNNCHWQPGSPEFIKSVIELGDEAVSFASTVEVHSGKLQVLSVTSFVDGHPLL